MATLEDMATGVEKGDEASVAELNQKAIAEGITATDILDKGLVAVMSVVGEKFKNGEAFIPEVLISARARPRLNARIKTGQNPFSSGAPDKAMLITPTRKTVEIPHFVFRYRTSLYNCQKTPGFQAWG